MISSRSLVAAAVAVGLAIRSDAGAQSAPATTATAASAQSQPATSAAPFTAGWQDGFIMQSANGDYRLAIGLVAQMDGRFPLDEPTPIVNTFTVRKVRPTFSGRLARYFDFKVMPDFGNGAAVVQDAYFDIRFSPAIRVRTGKDKTPIGYELLIGDAFVLFPERSIASSLVPNRDIGVQVQGDLAGGRVFYGAGVFNGVPDGSSTTTELDTNNGKDLAGRIVMQPFRAAASSAPAGPLAGLGFQLGGSTGRQTGALPSFRTSVGQSYFSYAGTIADGDRRRVSPAVFYYYKAFGVFAEYMRSSQSVTKGGIGTDVTNDAWNVTGSYVLTGENGADRGVRPNANFDPPTGGWGAFQIVARYAELHLDDDIFARGLAAAGANRQAQSFTVGANWYPVSIIKYYATFERTVFDGDADGARPAEDVILFRAQVAF
ncbi:MAG: porin [Luteitalea sp.]|nr:porin [Luteitalea sp.]